MIEYIFNQNDGHAKRLRSTICHFTLGININHISIIASAKFPALL